MDNAEKFQHLQVALAEYCVASWISGKEYLELEDFIDKIEERWDMFEEEN